CLTLPRSAKALAERQPRRLSLLQARSLTQQIIGRDANQRDAAFLSERQPVLRTVGMLAAQLRMAGDEVEIRRKPWHGQVAQQAVGEGIETIQIDIEREAGRRPRAVAPGKQREDHPLDRDAAVIERAL